jgi:hypothetical protein
MAGSARSDSTAGQDDDWTNEINSREFAKGHKPMGSKKFVEKALNVLVAWTDGRKPVPADVNILRTAFPSVSHLPVDDLACYVIHHLSGRTLKESGRIGVGRPDITRVA